mgnify:FL=1
MKTFTKMAAQGDFVIVRINQLPDNIESVSPRDGFIVIAHSETGHDHLMLADRVEAYKPANVKDADLYEMFLKVEEPANIEHMRSHDTHETLQVPAGNYMIRRQREYVPEGFRRAAD